jgi:hypothetical protein
MAFVATTQELEWSCGEDPGSGQPEPGTCPDGTPRALRRLALPHGDHNPRHGGLLFMAADGFHHLEGALGSDRRFRLYFYDDFTRPLDARAFSARAGDRPLEVSADHRSLELAGTGFAVGPVEISVKVRFPGGDREEPFDFVLEDAAGGAALEPAVEPTDLRQAIRERARRVDELVRRGAWPDLFIPALEAKDLALALLEREGDRVAAPVKTLVRAAWLLDLYGDLGKKTEVEAAQRLFARGVAELEGAGER